MDINIVTTTLTSDNVEYSYLWPQDASIQTASKNYATGEIELICNSQISVSAHCEGLAHSFIFGLSTKVDYTALLLESPKALKELEAVVYINEDIIDEHMGYIMASANIENGEHRDMRNSVEEKALRRHAVNKMNEQLQTSIHKGESTTLTNDLLVTVARAFQLATENSQEKAEELEIMLMERPA